MSFIPTAYKVVPWDYDEDTCSIILAAPGFVPSEKYQVVYKKITQGKLWFDRPVFDNIEWAYSTQKDKLIALLSNWLIFGKRSIKDTLLHNAIQYSTYGKTQCNWLFTDKVLFGGEPNMTLAQLLLDIEEHFLKFDF